MALSRGHESAKAVAIASSRYRTDKATEVREKLADAQCLAEMASKVGFRRGTHSSDAALALLDVVSALHRYQYLFCGRWRAPSSGSSASEFVVNSVAAQAAVTWLVRTSAPIDAHDIDLTKTLHGARQVGRVQGAEH